MLTSPARPIGMLVSSLVIVKAVAGQGGNRTAGVAAAGTAARQKGL